MALFTYSARDASGAVRQGQVEAVSVQAARAELRGRGLEAEQLYEAPSIPAMQPAELPPPPAPTAPVLQQQPVGTPRSTVSYFPLVDTLRIYAGWLLAFLSLAYLMGEYQVSRELPFRMPYVEAFLISPLLLEVAFGTFLFLLLSTIYRRMSPRPVVALLLTAAGLMLFALYQMNIE